jgi:H+/Cl- antiporter ClcA
VSTHAVTILVFALLGAVLIGLELAARTAGSRIPTVSRLLSGGLGRRSVQVLVVLSWWWVGWHFFGDAGR